MQEKTVVRVARIMRAKIMRFPEKFQMLSRVVPAALMLAAVGCGQSENSVKDTVTDTKMELAPASLVLTNGKIATVDDALGTQESIAVTGHIITAVGSNEDIAP
ncbi:MAG: hypothetical protein HN683_02290, partial [Gammaproteobacteria bacterium]|nr:hypothetical protein [Gammaproteobacteria bacterium]